MDRVSKLRGGFQYVLAIVEDEEQLLGPQPVRYRRFHRAPVGLTRTQRAGYHARDQLRIGYRCEVCDPHAVRKAIEKFSAYLHGEPAFADAACTKKRDQAVLAQMALHFLEVVLAAMEGLALHGQIVGYPVG